MSAALIAGMTLGNIGGNLMPVLLTGYAARFGLSGAGSGGVAAAQLLTTAALTLVLARRATRPGRARMARVGLVVAAAGFACAALAPDPAVLTVANVLAGAGVGAVFAASAAGLAATGDADRASRVAVLGSTAAIAVLLVAVPAADGSWGTGAGFAVVAVCCVPAFVLVGRLPERPGQSAMDAVPSVGAPGVVLLGAVALLIAADQGTWSYAAVFGEEHVHLSSSAVSAVLAVAGICALGGVVAGSLGARRFGRVPVLAGCLALRAVATCVVVSAGSAVPYAVAMVVWQCCYLAVLVLVLAAAADIDAGGRWAAALSGATTVGTGLGPPAVGVLLDAVGPRGLGVVLLLASCVAAVPLLGMARGSGGTAALERLWGPGRAEGSGVPAVAGALGPDLDGVDE
ncbi:MFS transporter [Streptantibioticus ferralitis]|uniref:MFS transporter n=1 Tax=Streptantibioticus ferralitis TaxID=236510 RepID=A0ABT5Z9S3_9ACTN|nr:MFS transporter [Streptantibioticus ferralitis]MDF2260514.1 MFS transporter [Streptantibioticus ferralitis]